MFALSSGAKEASSAASLLAAGHLLPRVCRRLYLAEMFSLDLRVAQM